MRTEEEFLPEAVFHQHFDRVETIALGDVRVEVGRSEQPILEATDLTGSSATDDDGELRVALCGTHNFACGNVRYLSELVLAEEFGLDGVVVNEHHQNAYGLMPSPHLMAAALALWTVTLVPTFAQASAVKNGSQ